MAAKAQLHPVPDRPDQKLDNAVDTFIQGAGQVSAALLGMINKVGGQIYALLFLNEEPLSLDDLAERLQISKSNISINIRLLEEYKLVRKVWVKGSRKDYYAAERTYPRKVIRDFLDRIQRNLLDAITTIERTRAQTREAKVDCAGDERVRADFILGQLDLIGSFYYAANQFIADFFNGKAVNLDLLRMALATPEEFIR
ncbi:MAG: MarR family transcriptional regulator [Deltaproteobacteria bacterium]|nr:MarR family transcriptional regulator [Deltaproteobacteria bacterium]